MRLDAMGVLFSNSWKRFQGRFVLAVEIFLPPMVLILISELLIARKTFPAVMLGGVIEFIYVLVSIVASVALISMFGKGTDFAASYRAGIKLFWPAIWISIIVIFATMGAFFLLIIPGIMLMIQLVFTNYTLVLEGKHGMSALTQSREYVKGYWWAILGRLLLLILCLFAANLVLGAPATLLGGFIFGRVVYALILLVFAPFSVAFACEVFGNLQRLKPDIAHVAVKNESAFLKVAIVVGIVGAVAWVVLIVAALIFFPATLVQWQAAYKNGYPYNNCPACDIQLATSTAGGLPGEMLDSPTSGPVGTTVTIAGLLDVDATNTILMNNLVAARNIIPAADNSLTFVIPESLSPDCDSSQICPQFLINVSSGTTYDVVVENVDGEQLVGKFTITEASNLQ